MLLLWIIGLCLAFFFWRVALAIVVFLIIVLLVFGAHDLKDRMDGGPRFENSYAIGASGPSAS